ncbi:MAG: multiheme c-type cytochrome [Bryobacteraceae bacterium]
MKRVGLAACLAALLLVAFAALYGASKKPVYLGARACGGCHTGVAMGNQYSLWLKSKHSQAYAALAKPESKRIAQISGLRQEPQQAPICLGCHATAFNAEGWEKDDDFRTEDGVQCELCHGPGSEYAVEEVMRAPEAARRAGLRMPTEQDCMNCHMEKGSHVAVLKSPQIDIKKAWRDIAHPLPGKTSSSGIPRPPMGEKPGPKHVGSAACGACHKGREMGHQYSMWRMSPHAKAWAALGTPRANEIAAEQKVQGDPQKSPQCLKCHSTGQGGAFLDSFQTDEGVGCEACHGPGSEYMQEAVMRDPRAAAVRGLKRPDRTTCSPCHEAPGVKPFKYEEALKQIAHPTRLPEEARQPVYKTPLNLAMSPDGSEVYVACEGSDSVAVVSTARQEMVAEIPVGGSPADVTFSPDGRLAFASNRHDDTVSVIDVRARKVTGTLSVGDEPHGVLTDKAARLLYVLNTSSDDISVFDVASLKQIKTLSAGRGPWSLALSPDGERLMVTNMYANFAFRAPFDSEISMIDATRGAIEERLKVAGANLMMGVDWHPSGEFALATLNRTKTLVPMTRLLQGWTITNGLAIVWRDGRVDEVLLDEPGMGFADATDVAFTPDGRHALVTSSGTDRVAVVDVGKLLALLRGASPYERQHVLPNHLGKADEFLVKHIPTRGSPRGILVARDGRLAYVADSLDDSLAVIDLACMKPHGRIDLGGPKEITQVRLGERLFHSANITFRKQYSCHSCHPDGHVDRMTYDIEADGIGLSPVDNRTLRGILDTAPFKWEGTNPSLQRQCGARLAVFFTRLAPFTPEQLAAVDSYITTIPRPLNRFRALGAALTPAQRRGKAIFERTEAAGGRQLRPEERCISCHFPPYYTDRRLHDVGTRHEHDRQGKFDTPHLNNIYDSAPYLHNGMAPTLEEIWTVYNPNDRHGVTNDMTKDQLNDLIEYLKTL